MVDTQMVGHIQLDAEQVRADLGKATAFRFSEAYSDYLSGGPWKSLMLWASGGDGGDGLITNYDHSHKSALTRYGEQLSYLRRLVEDNFHLENLNFARLAEIRQSVTFPHRDLLELGDIPQESRNAHRMHIPLVTDDGALFTEDNVVYQMKAGDIWFFDASRVHGAAALSDEPRTHLILDFTDAASAVDVVKFDFTPSGGVPEDRVCKRDVLTGAEREALYRLADVIDMDNWRDIAGIVAKKHYRKDGGENFVWGTLMEIGRRSSDPVVRAKLEQQQRFFLMERSA